MRALPMWCALVLSGCTLVVGSDPRLDDAGVDVDTSATSDAGIDASPPPPPPPPPTKDASPPDIVDAGPCDAAGCNAQKQTCKTGCANTAKTCNDACTAEDGKSCHDLCNQQMQACNTACVTTCNECVNGCGPMCGP